MPTLLQTEDRNVVTHSLEAKSHWPKSDRHSFNSWFYAKWVEASSKTLQSHHSPARSEPDSRAGIASAVRVWQQQPKQQAGTDTPSPKTPDGLGVLESPAPKGPATRLLNITHFWFL